MDPYRVLGVAPGAGRQEIRAAYLRLARHWHPDTNRERDAHDRFVEIQLAYEELVSGRPAPRAAQPASDLATQFAREFFRRMQQGIDAAASSFELAGIRVTVKYK